jgi:PASTA domain
VGRSPTIGAGGNTIPANNLTVKAVALLLALGLAPAAAGKPPTPQPASQPYGTIAVCAQQGARPVTTGPLTFTIAAPPSAGGTHIVTVALSACSAPIWYPSGTTLSILETVPSGDAVTAISLAGSGALTATTFTAGSAAITVGTAAGSVTFTTSGPATPSTAANCKVPGLFGLTVAGAKARLKAHACTLGSVRRVYSRVIRAGYVMRQSPGKGQTLAHGAPVSVTVSRGPQS